MSQLFKIMKDDGAIAGWIYTLSCIGLCIFGVVSPPQGIIDGSILAACSILLAFKTVDAIPNMIKAVKDGKQVIVHHKDTDVTISSKKEDENDETNTNSTL